MCSDKGKEKSKFLYSLFILIHHGFGIRSYFLSDDFILVKIHDTNKDCKASGELSITFVVLFYNATSRRIKVWVKPNILQMIYDNTTKFRVYVVYFKSVATHGHIC